MRLEQEARRAFLSVANAMNQPTKLERRLRATLLLTSVSCLYLMSMVVAISYSLDLPIISWIGDLWPWRSSNPKSLANPAFFVTLVFGVPLLVLWLAIGSRVEERIGDSPSPDWVWEVLSWGFLLMLFASCVLTVWARLPWASLALQTIVIIVVRRWLAKRCLHRGSV